MHTLQLHFRLTDPNIETNLLNNCISDIDTWLTNNSLSLNYLKTESLHIETTSNLLVATIFLSPQIIINNLSISYSSKKS